MEVYNPIFFNNKLSFNVYKFKFINFTSTGKPRANNPTVKVMGKTLNPFKSASFLGLQTDEHLYWKHQMCSLSKTLNKVSYALRTKFFL